MIRTECCDNGEVTIEIHGNLDTLLNNTFSCIKGIYRALQRVDENIADAYLETMVKELPVNALRFNSPSNVEVVLEAEGGKREAADA